jgi:hypothetical protein
MPSVDIQITNLREIRKAFQKSPELMEKELNIAIKKALLTIQAETILNVHPARGINVITGGLESAAERPPTFTKLKGIYEININYAPFVHEGTRFMRARPFLRHAVEDKSRGVQEFFTKAVDNVLNEIGKET